LKTKNTKREERHEGLVDGFEKDALQFFLKHDMKGEAMKGKARVLLSLLVCFTLVLGADCYSWGTKKKKDETNKQEVSQKSERKELKGPKLRVGIFKFQNKSTYGQGKLGQSATDIFITELVKTDKFIVIERSEMDQFEKEHNLVAAGVVDPSTAVKAGKVLGLNAIVYGTITQFAISEGYKDYGIYKKRTDIVDCVVDVRIIDAQTGQILFADTGKGRTQSEKKQFFGLGERGSYDQTLAENALRASIVQLFDNMIQRMAEVPWSGKVAAVDSENIYLNAGKETGLEIGDILTVYRPGKEIIDPDTKLSMGYTRTKVATIKVESYFGRNGSIAKKVSGGKIKENDIVTYEQ